MAYTTEGLKEIKLLLKPGIDNLIKDIFSSIRQDALDRLDKELHAAMGSVCVRLYKVVKAEIIGTELIIRVDTKDLNINKGE